MAAYFLVGKKFPIYLWRYGENTYLLFLYFTIWKASETLLKLPSFCKYAVCDGGWILLAKPFSAACKAIDFLERLSFIWHIQTFPDTICHEDVTSAQDNGTCDRATAS